MSRPSLKRRAGDLEPAAPAKVPKQDALVFFSKSKDATARALSNFAPSAIELDGRWYPTVEHYYQSRKFAPQLAERFSTPDEDGVPACGATGRDAKSAGGKARMKAVGACLSATWDDQRVPVMQRALHAKFALPHFHALLLQTHARPLNHFERSPGFWGTHVSAATGQTKGENQLGKMLMQMRTEKQAAAAAEQDVVA